MCGKICDLKLTEVLHCVLDWSDKGAPMNPFWYGANWALPVFYGAHTLVPLYYILLKAELVGH